MGASNAEKLIMGTYPLSKLGFLQGWKARDALAPEESRAV